MRINFCDHNFFMVRCTKRNCNYFISSGVQYVSIFYCTTKEELCSSSKRIRFILSYNICLSIIFRLSNLIFLELRCNIHHLQIFCVSSSTLEVFNGKIHFKMGKLNNTPYHKPPYHKLKWSNKGSTKLRSCLDTVWLLLKPPYHKLKWSS